MKQIPDSIRMDPVFVIGYKRSGTTMLRLMLNAHPEVAIPPEGEYFQRVPSRFKEKMYQEKDIEEITTFFKTMKYGYFQKNTKFDEVLFKEILAKNVPFSLPGLLASPYLLWASMTEKPFARWGDKKPQHWPLLYQLRKWYQDAQFVHIVRDPRDSVASNAEKLIHRVPLKKIIPSHITLAWHWNLAHKTMKAEGKILGEKRYLMVRYEDLVENPEKHLIEICSFLNIEFHERMLDFHKDTQDPLVLSERKKASAVFAETTKPLHTGRVGRYKELSEQQLCDIEYICGAAMEELAYKKKYASLSLLQRSKISSLMPCYALSWKMLRAFRRVKGSP